jgi:hypothetical protein
MMTARRWSRRRRRSGREVQSRRDDGEREGRRWGQGRAGTGRDGQGGVERP